MFSKHLRVILVFSSFILILEQCLLIFIKGVRDKVETTAGPNRKFSLQFLQGLSQTARILDLFENSRVSQEFSSFSRSRTGIQGNIFETQDRDSR